MTCNSCPPPPFIHPQRGERKRREEEESSFNSVSDCAKPQNGGGGKGAHFMEMEPPPLFLFTASPPWQRAADPKDRSARPLDAPKGLFFPSSPDYPSRRRRLHPFSPFLLTPFLPFLLPAPSMGSRRGFFPPDPFHGRSEGFNHHQRPMMRTRIIIGSLSLSPFGRAPADGESNSPHSPDRLPFSPSSTFCSFRSDS